MWQINNRTPFAVDRDWVRDRHGAEVWVVAVKATFDIKPDGSTDISELQPPVQRVPEHHGEPGKSSIKYETDLVLTKNTTDILVIGHACAPDERPVTVLDAGFRVGTVQKMIRVFGDRRWGAIGPTAPAPFTRMPLLYERSFGGVDTASEHPGRNWDWRNPVGCGFAVSKGHLVGVGVPNLEWPEQLINAWDDRPAPAGFGAIAPHWQPRVSFAGTYDETWRETRHPLVPEDFDERFFQTAPTDQQAPQFLRGGEPVALLNLTPAGLLRFVLPTIHLGFETFFYDGSSEFHKTRRLHSVIVEPDFPRVSLVWHSALPCHSRVNKLKSTIVSLKQLIDYEQQTETSGGTVWPE